MATSCKADISETENFFWTFSCVSEICVKFGVFERKRISLIAQVLQKLLTAKQVGT